MKKELLLWVACFAAMFAQAQVLLTTPPSGENKKASVSERVGLTDITIHYDRPAVKGREGKIWGGLVYTGFGDLGFGNSKAAPWRAGANENTTIQFSNAVKIEGQPLPAGKYGFFIAYGPAECTLVFSKNSGSWGSYFYDAKEDALRVAVKPVPLEKSIERLKYEFSDETETGATITLQWEKLAIPFRVETDYINDQLAVFRQELRTDKGFGWQTWNQAAFWCLQRNVNLDQALLWADSATGKNFGGERAFVALNTKAQLLEKAGRNEEAAAVMKTALAHADMNEVHLYGRTLMQQKKLKEAIAVFKDNYKKHPNEFTTLVGMTRAYSAMADYKAALKYAQQALSKASEINTRNNLQEQIAKLQAGKDIN
ncbi:DUF2911 domain-containing protein [Niabella sp.]|uniref:DUF2911 domain-containing protein n=1 Tax=Niabella sp. TaxID=1962976 RepID=UPI002607B49E|nr:DUF2911 domain-containing protein [Niabella sp.]